MIGLKYSFVNFLIIFIFLRDSKKRIKYTLWGKRLTSTRNWYVIKQGSEYKMYIQRYFVFDLRMSF